MLDEFATAAEVLDGIDLRGRYYLVTGGSTGLGAETARALATCGATVVCTARDAGQAEARAAEAIASADTTSGSLAFVNLDLGSLASVRSCADQVRRMGYAFDAIIANAGVLAAPFDRTTDGFEPHFGINHLGHFLLVNRLLPSLATGGRVVILSASGHGMADIDLEDLNYERSPYQAILAYNRSKTANILFARELDRRYKMHGHRATAVHPGVISTDLGRNVSPELGEQLMRIVRERYGSAEGLPWQYKTLQQGAATTVWAAVTASPDEIGGHYCEDCHVAEVTNDPRATRGVQSYALDDARAKRLWSLSEELVGETF